MNWTFHGLPGVRWSIVASDKTSAGTWTRGSEKTRDSGRWVMPHASGRLASATVLCPHWSRVIGPTTTQPILTTICSAYLYHSKKLLNVTFHALLLIA